MAEHKRPQSPVSRTPEQAFIVFNEGFSTLDCVVYSGANLKFENAEDVPLRFLLHVDDTSPSSQCLVIWRMGSLLGVEFEEDDIRWCVSLKSAGVDAPIAAPRTLLYA